MSEQHASRVRRSEHHLEIGASALHWDGSVLEVRLDERCMPLPRALRGRVLVRPRALTGHVVSLAPGHGWSPIAPSAAVSVELDEPALRWTGSGYLDSNWGSAPLERDFRRWNWCRAPLDDGATAILYDTVLRDGRRADLALRVGAQGTVAPFDPGGRAALPATLWRLARETRSARPERAEVLRTLTDSPFYSRSLLRTDLLGSRALAMHESLDLDRFTRPWTQAMLPFRVRPALPGRAGRSPAAPDRPGAGRAPAAGP